MWRVSGSLITASRSHSGACDRLMAAPICWPRCTRALLRSDAERAPVLSMPRSLRFMPASFCRANPGGSSVSAGG